MQVVNYVNSQQEHEELCGQIPGASSGTVIPLQAEQVHFLITPTSELN